MNKKLIVTLISFLIIIIFFFLLSNKIISYYTLKTLSKWTEHEVTADKINISYDSNIIEIKNLRILNKPGFLDQNILEAKNLNIKINLVSIFSDLVLIEKLVIEKPRFFFEIRNTSNQSKNDDIILQDNVGLVEKITTEKPSKIYPPKKKDKNFLIKESIIKNSKAFIRYPNNTKILAVDLSNMYFQNIGNSNPNKDKNYQHYKDIIKLIFNDIYFRIPDKRLRNFIKDNYKIKINF